MQDVSYDLLADVILWLLPGQLQATGAEGQGLEPVGGLGQLGPLTDGEAGAGLVGAGTVLCDALIDGLVLWGDTSDDECPAGGDREQPVSLQDGGGSGVVGSGGSGLRGQFFSHRLPSIVLSAEGGRGT